LRTGSKSGQSKATHARKKTFHLIPHCLHRIEQ
jgi:hypothetical protein